mmetsp:Transcript_32392/g.112041  ORF Transcript_32392/g.112041 Transcript_32392/m.112041 type:complete len:203 (+) Transcript_32392:264-872(+)
MQSADEPRPPQSVEEVVHPRARLRRVGGGQRARVREPGVAAAAGAGVDGRVWVLGELERVDVRRDEPQRKPEPKKRERKHTQPRRLVGRDLALDGSFAAELKGRVAFHYGRDDDGEEHALGRGVACAGRAPDQRQRLRGQGRALCALAVASKRRGEPQVFDKTKTPPKVDQNEEQPDEPRMRPQKLEEADDEGEDKRRHCGE